MKFVIDWTSRVGGDAIAAEKAAKRNMDLFSKWEPGPNLRIESFLISASGDHGYVIAETDNVQELAESISKFVPYAEFRVEPVLEAEDWVRAAQVGISFRNGIS